MIVTPVFLRHYNDVIMSPAVSQITSLTIVYSSVYSGAGQRKHQSSASLAFVRGIHRWPVNSPHKGPATRKMFSFDDVIMITHKTSVKSVIGMQTLYVSDKTNIYAYYYYPRWRLGYKNNGSVYVHITSVIDNRNINIGWKSWWFSTEVRITIRLSYKVFSY